MLETPSVDKRDYRHYQIRELDILLISDPATDKASAACDIHVGQLCDPLPGLAHFCEHMLFIGTTKYPTENAYDQYLSQNGGSSNAFTDLEHTCYYFDVHAPHLEGALDRFAQCFISPLFTQSALEREILAVDSEHQKNLQQDLWRMHQLSKSVLPGEQHKFASFGSGNQESLPILNIREHLLKFYQDYYRKSLALYKLVVLGKESLDELQTMVDKYFRELADCEDFQQQQTTIAPSALPFENPLLKEWYPPVKSWQVPQRLHIVPVETIHAVELQFPMVAILEHYTLKPTRYLSHLLGHEGKGSLLSLLKARNWAQELYADDSTRSCLTFSIFTIRMELTDAGLEHVDEVVTMVFAYLDLLRTRGPQEWIQQELKTVGDLQFRFLSQREPVDYTCSLAGWMQHYRPEHYLSGPYKIYADWNPTVVQECLSYLRPDNLLLLVSSPTFQQEEEEGATTTTTMQKEKWYGTLYQSVDMDFTVLDQWNQIQHTSYPELTLPEANDMIATDFDLLTSPANIPADVPQCLWDAKAVRLWYKPDNVFAMPKVNMMFKFESGEVLASPEGSVAMRLFVELVQDHVNEFTYLASMAGLHCEVASSPSGLECHVSGYHHKAHVLAERVMKTMMEEIAGTSDDQFGRIAYKIEQQFKSFLVAQPYQHAIYGGDLCLEHISHTVEEKLAALQNLSLQEVLLFAKRFWKHCRLEALIHGNVSATAALDVTTSLWGQLERSADETCAHTSVERRATQLSPGSSYLYQFAEFNPANTNSVLQIVLQIGPVPLEENATLAFLHHLIREPAFNQLRTEEQLGYIVHTSIKTSGVHAKGFLFLIQSDAYDPIHVEGRVEEFLEKFRSRIQSMSMEHFQQNIDAVVTSFLEKNKNLGEESSRYWHVILNETYNFRRLQQLAEYVKSMTRDRALRFFDKYIAKSAPCRKKFCVQVFAQQHQEKMGGDCSEKGTTRIEDAREFKRCIPLYPLPPRTSIDVVKPDIFEN